MKICEVLEKLMKNWKSCTKTTWWHFETSGDL